MLANVLAGKLHGKTVTVYAQHEVLIDPIAKRLDYDGQLLFEVDNATAHDLISTSPAVRFTDSDGNDQILDCDFVAGCDGSRTYARILIPEGEVRKDYGRGRTGSSDGLTNGAADRLARRGLGLAGSTIRFFHGGGEGVHTWHDMFIEQIPLAEKMIRTILVYVLLMVLFRLTGKRGLAAMNTVDFIVVFLLSNVVQNAVIGDHNSVLGGMVGAVTLVAVNAGVNWLTAISPTAERLFEGPRHEGHRRRPERRDNPRRNKKAVIRGADSPTHVCSEVTRFRVRRLAPRESGMPELQSCVRPAAQDTEVPVVQRRAPGTDSVRFRPHQ